MQPSHSSNPAHQIIDTQLAGVRVDRFIADWRGLSRAAVLRLLEQGGVICNGRSLGRKNKGDLLQVGDELELLSDFIDGESPRADLSFELNVIAEGRGWLVVNKPAGVPVRPHRMDESGTVLNAVAARYPEILGVGEGGLRSGVVHRLDTDTSGALLFATEQAAWDRFRVAFTTHRIQKRYLALVHGSPHEQAQVCRDLRVASHRPAKVVVAPESTGGVHARRCSLGWRVIERFADWASLIEVDLHTGFLHQVRAMMSEQGHPVLGDTTYGLSGRGAVARLIRVPRQMLHAYSLEHEEIQAMAPMPEDMLRVIETLR